MERDTVFRLGHELWTFCYFLCLKHTHFLPLIIEFYPIKIKKITLEVESAYGESLDFN